MVRGRIKKHPILEFSKGKEVRFTFEGKEMKGYEGEPIAAALHANGVRILSYSPELHRPRGFFCATGKCSSCLVIVDGIPNIRSCMTPLQEGMNIKRQRDKGDFSAAD